MKIRIQAFGVAFVLLLFARASDAGEAGSWDYWVGAGARTLPLAASLVGELGYLQPVWGDRADGNPFHGFVRPAVRLQSSALVNSARASVAIHPVSFWKLEASYGQSHRATTIGTLDCDLLECGGAMGRGSVGTSLVLARAGFFGGWSSMLTDLSLSRAARPFGDENTALAGNPGGDRLISHEGFLGYEIRPDLRAGYLFARERMLGTGAHSTAHSGFARLERGTWTYTVGAGVFESVTQALGASVFGSVRWNLGR